MLQIGIITLIHFLFFPLTLYALLFDLGEDAVGGFTNDIGGFVLSLFVGEFLHGLFDVVGKCRFIFLRGSSHIVALRSFGMSFFMVLFLSDKA